MKNIDIAGLDSLIAIDFGQDYDLSGSGESVDAQINAWIADSPSASRHGLIGDIDPVRYPDHLPRQPNVLLESVIL